MVNNIDDYQHFYKSIAKDGSLKKEVLVNFIENTGISITDPRLNVDLSELPVDVDYNMFYNLVSHNTILFEKIFHDNLIVPDWQKLKKNVKEIYDDTIDHTMGLVADYIPQLAKVDANLYGVSICSVDGQRLNIGDTKEFLCMQSCSKPITYCIAMDLNGSDVVHNFIGREPSGRNFNELCLNPDNLPHNPLINSGAIMATSLIEYKKPLADRFDIIIDYWSKMAGGTKIGFNNSVYLSERDTADRNFCLAYMMQESNAFSNGKDSKYKRDWNKQYMQENLDLYFQCCSIELDCEQASMVAATLANGGVCPLTNRKVFDPNIIKNALSMMSSCGLYDYSGEWIYTIGIPAKSGVSGLIIGVVPNVMGIAVFSPRLDELGNSSRGIKFFKELTQRFNFHIYDNAITSNKQNIVRNEIIEDDVNIFRLLNAASKGDIKSIRTLYVQGVDLSIADYDGRTALHLAASEGHLNVVKYLLTRNIYKDPIDRWNNTPLDDAKRHEFSDIIELLSN